jgi:hypothetical protein
MECTPVVVKALGRTPANGHEVSFTPEQFRVNDQCLWCTKVLFLSSENDHSGSGRPNFVEKQ